jgi:hypothetical protein
MRLLWNVCCCWLFVAVGHVSGEGDGELEWAPCSYADHPEQQWVVSSPMAGLAGTITMKQEPHRCLSLPCGKLLEAEGGQATFDFVEVIDCEGPKSAACGGKNTQWTTLAPFSGGTDVFGFKSVQHPDVCMNVAGSLTSPMFKDKHAQLLVWSCSDMELNFDFRYDPKTHTITPPVGGYRDKVSGGTEYKWLDKQCDGEHATDCCLGVAEPLAEAIQVMLGTSISLSCALLAVSVVCRRHGK